MRNLLLIYEVDEEYIKRVLSFFKFFCLKEGLLLNFYAKRWLKSFDSDNILFVDDNFNIQTTKIKNLDYFHFSIILSLNPEFEHQNHQKISEYLKKYKINQLNPFFVSFLSSNKYKTIEKIRKFKIYTPSSLLIEFKDRKNLKEKIEKFIKNQKTQGFYIQPNYGTEGKQTYFFTKTEIIKNFNFLIETVMSILPEQPVIIKEKRGNVYYFKEDEKILGYRDVVLRFFIFEYKRKIFSNWCFFEISPDEKFPITSPYKGGKILNFKDIKNNLYYRIEKGFEKFILTETHKIQIISEIKKIFKFFNKGLKEKLKIGGMDILLETDGKNLKIIFLELNPRPSGIDKLDYFDFT
ncbi:MAG: hypothetical protein NC915_00050 [Candidatus Omnitrophica bacterium]|nr:hypothetical protein [Candidatus Omnitrophota bacterium]